MSDSVDTLFSIVDDIQTKLPTMTKLDALKLAVELRKSEAMYDLSEQISLSFGTGLVGDAPAFLEAIAMQIKESNNTKAN